MKTVSQPWGEKLAKAGWVKETAFKLVTMTGEHWLLEYAPRKNLSQFSPSRALPSPTCDEIGEELSYLDFVRYFEANSKVGGDKWSTFPQWLHSTLLDPDKMTEVWIAVKGAPK